jgi:hypothetical protein
VYKVYINGKLVRSVVNSKPLEFKKVQVWLGDPWYRAQPGVLTDLLIALVAVPAPTPQIACIRRCPRIYQPVCDNQGRTHPSGCLFAIAKCRITKLKIVHNGPCEVVPPPPCARLCPRLLRPVCDSMGETHLNECQFTNAKCLTPQLKIVHDGRCRAPTVKPPTVKPKSTAHTFIEGSVRYIDVHQGTCTSVTKAECKSIALSRRVGLYEITGRRHKFPPGCYHKRTTNKVYFNPSASRTHCTSIRACICKPGSAVRDAVQISPSLLDEDADIEEQTPLVLDDKYLEVVQR